MPVSAQNSPLGQTVMAQEIGNICAKVLNRPIARMKMDKSFVAQGGDSLLAIQLMARCREAGYHISIANILRATSIDELSRSVEFQPTSSTGGAPMVSSAKEATVSKNDAQAILSDLPRLDVTYNHLDELVINQLNGITSEPLKTIENIFPCSPTQEVFLFSQQANPEMYQCAVVVEIKSTEPGIPLDYDRLCNAWKCMVERHSALRTFFIESASRPGHFDQVILKHETVMKHETVPLECHLSSDQYETSVEGIFSRRAVVSKEKNTQGRAIIWKRSESCAVFRLEISHALLDGQSFSVIFHDFAKAYLQTQLPGFVVLPYHEFVTYQEQLNRESMHAYWSNYLAGAQPTLFPTNSRRGFEDLKMLSFRFGLNAAAEHKLRVQYDATTANLFQVAWALVLGSYAGSNDVCFSYATSGRQAPLRGIENAVGAFVDVIICRVRLSGAEMISQTLSRAKHDVAEGLSWPGSFLFKDEKQGQKMSELRGNSIMTFQTGVEDEQLAGSGLQIVTLDEINASEYDISLNIKPCFGGLDIRLDYWLSRTDQQMMENVAESFQKALACLINEDMPLRDIDVVPARQIEQMRRQNLYAVTKTESLLHDDVGIQALLNPDAFAVQGWDGDLTYRTLDEETNKLASYLQHLGAQRETMICTCFEKSKWVAVSQLAIVKSGATVVPLGINQPMRRLELMIKDTGADIMLTTSNFASRFAALFRQVIVVDDAFMAKIPPADAVSSSASPDSLAFVIYTSGSTGVPKGVMLTHGSLLTTIRHYAEAFHPIPNTRVLQFSPYTFDAAILDFFSTWHIGACLCIVSEHDRLNRLAQAICELQVNWATLTPAMADVISPDEVPSLKRLLLAGEAAKPSVVHRWLDRVELWNGYGPTECSIGSSVRQFTRECSTMDIGYPISGAFWVVDATNADRLVPTGAIGELLIEGPHLSRGYLNDEQKTSLAFITEPAWVSKYGFVASSRYYRTGDLFRQKSDGSFIFIGRRDTQVKLRGQRVEIAEIEQHLTDHDAVDDAAVVLAANGPCKGKLVALLSLNGFISQGPPPKTLVLIDQENMTKAKLQTDGLYDWLSDRVPGYMVPTIWIPVMSRLLQTESGKLDRVRLEQFVDAVDVNWLEAFASAAEELAQGVGATALQLRIRQIWAEVLLLPVLQVPIGRRSFLSLGGDSITAMKAVARARTEGITLAVPDILQSKSIAQLTENLGPAEASMLDDASVYESFPLSPTQQWYFDLVHPLGSGSIPGHFHRYSRRICLQINQQLDKKHIADCVKTLVSMHPMLRARFCVNAANEWQQRVAEDDDASYGFQVSYAHSLDTVSDIAEATEQRLNIENGPIFCAQLISFEADYKGSKQLLLMTGHQLVMDEESVCILVSDLEQLLCQHPPATLSAEPLSFQAWVRGVGEAINEGSESAVAYQTPRVRASMPKPGLRSWNSKDSELLYDQIKTEVIVFDEDDTLLFLGSSNRALRTVPVELLLSVLAFSFTSAFPSRSIPTFCERRQRKHFDHSVRDLSRTVGCFAAIVPLRFSAANVSGAVEFLKETKDSRRNIDLCRSHSWYPDNPQNHCGIPSAHHDTIEVVLNFDDSAHRIQQQCTLLSQQNLERRKKSPAEVIIGQPSAIHVDATILQNRLHVAFQFDSSSHNENDISCWSREFYGTMRALLADLLKTPCTLTRSDFPLLDTTSQRLETLKDETLPSIGLQPENVEDIYPCTPLQNGILMSQARSPWMYQTQMLWRLQSPDIRRDLSVNHIIQAYQTLTDRHPMLRTIFVPRTLNAGDGAFDQVVLRSYTAAVSHKTCQEDNPDAMLAAITWTSTSDYGHDPNHRFIVYSTPSGRIYGHLVINHALSDGFSLDLLQKELTDAYEERLTSDSRAPLYSAYMSFLQQSKTEEDLQYWIQNLSDAEACFLPALTEAKQESKGSEEVASPPVPMRRQLITASLENAESVRQFGDEYTVTMANVFQLAWALVLSKFVRSTDILFGYASSGRDVPVHEAHQIFGPFVNILVSRIKLDFDSSVSENLQRVQKRFFDGFSRERTPLVDIWHALKTGSRGLFNTYLSYRQAISTDYQRCSLVQDTIGLLGDSEYDVGVDIVASNKSVSVSLDYLPSFMSRDAATRLVDCLVQTVQSLVQGKSSLLRDVLTTTAQDIHQICQWNSNIPSATSQQSIHDTVYSQHCLNPAAMAICSWDGDLTYSELDRLGEQLGFYLASDLGVSPETMIGVCFDKSRWAIVAQMAILKSGAVVVPINPNDPMQRLETILLESGICTLLTTSRYSGRFLSIISNVITVDSSSSIFHNTALIKRIDAKVKPENAAFVIHTSGSTGSPKGVVLTHRSIASGIQAQGKVLGLNSQTRAFQFVSYTFDVSISDIWATLSHGGCVCVPSEEDRMNNIQGAMQSYGVNFANMTPTVATLLNVAELPSLETLVLGGEALTRAFIEEHLKAPQLKIFNAYGPSECSIFTTCHGPLQDKSEASNIGRPLLGSVWLIDDTDNICPIGAVGEMWVEGPLLARDYLNKKELTDKAFPVDPPWARRAGLQGKRFYRTGDLARQHANGDIFYVGRKDWQVKIRGNRVELSEIECAIKELVSGIQNVVACLMHPSESSHGPLIAVVLEQDRDTMGMQADASDLDFQTISPSFEKKLVHLKTLLPGVLPSHMTPTLYVPITRLPLTDSGKVNRRILCQSLESFSEEKRLHYSLADVVKTPPTSETEKRLHTLWATVLQHQQDQVGVDDNFFHLGGDSYLAMRLVALAQASDSSISFTVSDVLQHPVIRDLAQVVNERSTSTQHLDTKVAPFSLWKEFQELGDKGQESESPNDALHRVATQCDVSIDDVEDVYPCTPLQEGLMLATAQQPRAYIARWAFQMRQDFDLERFKRSWHILGGLLPILRTRIVPGQSTGALQVVVRNTCTWHTSHDLDQYLDDDMAQSMTYGTSLVRFAYIQSSDGRRHFVWTAHHSIYDAWSLPLLLEAVSRIYLLNEVPSLLVPYPKFIQYIESQDPAAAALFWQSELEGDLGEPFPELPNSSYLPEPAQSIRCSISLESFKHSVTLATMLRAAWAATLSSNTGGTVLFAMPLSGRNAPVKGILDMMAPTFTTVPVRIQVDEKQLVTDYLDAVQRQGVNMVPFEHSGLQHIRSMVGREINPQHLFAIQLARKRDKTVSEGLLGMKQVTLPMDGFGNYSLIVECFASSQEGAPVEVLVRFDDNVLSRTQVTHLLNRFKHIFAQLSRVSAEAEEKTTSTLMGDIDYVSPEEVARLAFLNREVTGDKPGLVHELVLQHSITVPQKTAVCAWDGELSFRQLDQMSDALASRLTELGVTIESSVILCCDKSKWVVVGMMAILRAGGAVVPVKAEPVVARLQTIVETTGAKVIVTMAEFTSQLHGAVDHIVSMDEMPILNPKQPQDSVRQYPNTRNTSFIMFTSGSTGKPKGIVLEHGSMSTAIQSLVKRLGLNEHTRGFQFASLTFDMALQDILTPLAGGGCVCLPSEVERVNDLANAMRRLRVNYAMLTPRVLKTIKPSDCPGMRTVVVGGERCDAGELKLWLPQARVYHAYGPTECSMVSTVAEFTGSEALNLGYALVGALWVTNKDNCNQLCPIGTVGELLVEGPLVARGYLKDQVKTAASFIDYPPWRTRHRLVPNSQRQRMYRTGDLVIQHDDGSLVFVGRADQQLKIRGQRVEVGDIEHHIKLQPEVEDAIVLYPQKGPANSRLVGLVTLHEHMSKMDLKRIQPSSADHLPEAIAKTETIRQRLADTLPEYMVPHVWISLAFLPQSNSHKVDRRKLMDWVQSLDGGYFKSITAGKDEAPRKPASGVESQMQDIVADILGLPLADVSMGRSFLSMGGDSITAMQVVSQCRSRYGISIHVRDILQSKSITQLSLRAMTGAAIAPLISATNGEFRLSPIQQLFFKSFAARGLHSEDEYRFNQSICLVVNKRVEADQIEHAARGLVSTHSMLRARFTKSGKRWRQRISDDVDASCNVVFHQVKSRGEIEAVIWAGQRLLNVEKGPVFSVHCIENTVTGSQLLFLVSHHLVVDIVSWRIILRDLDELIQHPSLTVPAESTTFQHWLQLQSRRARDMGLPRQVIHPEMPIADWNYWGLTAESNTYGNRISEQFTIKDCASALFGENQPLRSEPVEVLLAALFHSFHQVFPERPVPTVFNEGHGREPWNDAIDLSNTVGWFTTMTPIHVSVGTGDIVEVLKRTKDLRRSIPERGFAYFTSRFLTHEGQNKFASHDQPEVLFNFGGRYRDDKHSRSLLTMTHDFNGSHISGIGTDVKRVSVFEVEAAIQQEDLVLILGFHKNACKLDRIARWFQTYQDSLRDLLHQLSVLPAMLTLTDVPLLNATYDDLHRLQNERLPLAGIQSMECIEDIYPCSPAQESILRSQARDPSTFHVHSICEFRARDASVVNPEILAQAWQTVVSRHAILRTVCVPPISQGDSFCQVVLRQYEPEVAIVRCETVQDVDCAFKEDDQLRYPKWKPEHQLTLCITSTGQVFFQLFINHALVDVSSFQLILNEVALAYENGILDTPAPPFSKYIAFLQESSVAESTRYWTSRLAGTEPRFLPALANPATGSQTFGNAHVQMSDLEPLHRFRDRYGITIANILQLAWAIVIARHSGSSDVLFGYVANGRDAPVDGVSQMAGPLINMMVSRICLRNKQLSVTKTAEQVQNDFMDAFKHQRISLTDIERATGLSEKQMLHTVVSIVREPAAREKNNVGVSVHSQSATSLAEYDVNLNAACGESTVTLSLQSSPRYLDSPAAKRLLENLAQTVLVLVANGEASIEEVESSIQLQAA